MALKRQVRYRGRRVQEEKMFALDADSPTPAQCILKQRGMRIEVRVKRKYDVGQTL